MTTTATIDSLGSLPDVQQVTGLNVKNFGAKGDGVTGDAAAIQAALTACGNAGGGVVNLPPGKYVLDAPFTVPALVTLRGTYRTMATFSVTGIGDGPSLTSPLPTSVLAVTAGAGNASGTATVTVETHAATEGVCFVHPNQDVTQATPTAYPFCVSLDGDGATARYIGFYNAYQGIRQRATRTMIERVGGQCATQMIYSDNCLDVSKISDVECFPVTGFGTNFAAWAKANGNAFVFGRNDLVKGHRMFAINMARAFQFVSTANGSSYGLFSDCGSDTCTTAIEVDASQYNGIRFGNGHFIANGSLTTAAAHLAVSGDATLSIVGSSLLLGPMDYGLIQSAGRVILKDNEWLAYGNQPTLKNTTAVLVCSGGRLVARDQEFILPATLHAAQSGTGILLLENSRAYGAFATSGTISGNLNNEGNFWG